MLKPITPDRWNFSTAAHLLNRAGFGGRPAEIESFARLKPLDAVEQLLSFTDDMPTADNPDWAKPDPERAAKFRAFRSASPEERQKLQQERNREHRQQMVELQHWWLRRMANGAHPLQEKLTLFWHGHFATSVLKVKEPYLMWRQNDLFRRLGAGSWRTLLEEVTRDPAMLIWLDQAQSKPEQPNENYARELMELFTLGEGHYTEKDVTEAARALTGLTLDREKLEPAFRKRLRDSRPKSILGKTGNLDAGDLIELIAGHEQSARFITGKLWNFFAGSPPSPELNAALAGEFREHGWNFRHLLRVLLLAEEFYAPSVVRQQIKSPVQLLVQACRQLERELPPPLLCTNTLRLLGQELLNPPNVKGWDGGTAWINTNTLLNRHNLALLLVTGENALPSVGPKPNKPAKRRMGERLRKRLSPEAIQPAKLLTPDERKTPSAIVAALERRLINAPLKNKDRDALLDYINAQGELDPRDLLGVIRLALCTSDYQIA